MTLEKIVSILLPQKVKQVHSLLHSYEAVSIEIPTYLVELLISGEDYRFYQHSGVDFYAICRAIWKRFRYGTIEGASTLQMQTIRVLSGRYERTWARKIDEMLLALVLNKKISKQELPKLYLSIAYYGWRMNGLEDAVAQLDIKLSEIGLWEGAKLIARLKYPEPQVMPPSRQFQISNRAKYILARRSRYFESIQKGFLGFDRHATI